MGRYRMGVSSLLCICALSGGCGAPSTETPEALEAQGSPLAASTCLPVAQVKDIAPSSASAFPDFGPQPPVALGSRAFFAANDGTTGLELWHSRGTEGDTALVKDIAQGAADADPRWLTPLGDTLFFIANDGAHGPELWKTDGTAEGTVLVKDIRTGPGGSEAGFLTVLGDTLFFVANDGAHGTELWKSDGTEAGTVLVTDLVPGTAGSGVSSLAVFAGQLYFAADGGPHEAELWKTDGSEQGTERVAVVRVIESDPSEQIIRGLTPSGGTLFFFAGSAYGQQWDLWKSDGTGEGTTRVQVLSLGPDDYQSGPVKMTPLDGQVFFRSGKGGSLWRSDGTREGTLVVKHSSDVRELTAFRGALLFTAWDQASGYELWKSDGTTAGTALVADLKPGGDSAAPFWLTVVDDQLLFSAETVEHGRELWKSDGTQAGTVLLHDLVPGEESAAPALLTIVGPRVFFLATDGANGVEPWVLNDCVAPELTCPADLTVEATGPNGAAVAWTPPRVADNKPATPVVGFSHASGNTFPLGTTPVTITATDESGNSSQCQLSVTVQDTRPPSLVCPTDQMVERQSRHGAVVHYQPASVRDEVSTPQLKYGIPSGSEFPLGTTEVWVTATDAAGNRAQCAFRVTVEEAMRRGGCGCGATSAGGLSGWLLLVALSRFAWWRRRK